jgi:heptosyltransferase-2
MQKLLVAKNRALGDAVMGLATIQYLKSLYPETQIAYAVPAWVAPLFSNVEIAADQIIPLNLGGLKGWMATAKKIHQFRPQAIFELFQSGRGKKFFSLYTSLTRTKYVAHDHHKKAGGPVFDQGVIKAVLQRDLDGAWSFFGDLSALPNHLDFAPQMTVANIQKKKRLIIGVVATRATKMWELKNYTDLAKKMSDYEIAIPLSTSAVDREIERQLIALGAKDLIVHLSLTDLPRFFAESSAYVGNDTGLKHIAVATGLPTLTLFGPEPPNEWHPYKTDRHHFLYREGLECRTREAHYCGLATCESMICLNQFTPEQVERELRATISK